MPKKEKLRVKKAYWKYFENSPTVMKIINSRFWKRTPKAKDTCSCGNVGYKSLSTLAIKQANTILDLGHAITAMEKSRAAEKDELVRIRLDAVERLNKQKAEIMKLENELENAEDAIYQKDSEIADLKDSIYLKREEVKNNAN
tara:strand:- start:1584 stop:2012 length:429 start_codon:yes stop_codon:yes gene_type:complete